MEMAMEMATRSSEPLAACCVPFFRRSVVVSLSPVFGLGLQFDASLRFQPTRSDGDSTPSPVMFIPTPARHMRTTLETRPYRSPLEHREKERIRAVLSDTKFPRDRKFITLNIATKT